MQTLKFKSQLMFVFFASVNHLCGPLRKQAFTLTSSKVHSLRFVIGGFRSILCVSVFQGSLLVIIHVQAVEETIVKLAPFCIPMCSLWLVLSFLSGPSLSPLSPTSDQDQFSPNNIHKLSTDKV